VALATQVRNSPTLEAIAPCLIEETPSATAMRVCKVGTMIEQTRQWARIVKRDAHAVYLAARDPRVPWYAKMLALCVAGYALSPIDLIPDFVPVLGYVDDVIIVPLGILAVVKLIPPEIMAEHRALAAAAQDRPVSRTAAIVIALVWAGCIALTGWLCYRLFAG
jgi:uncharacterized membrane protein YkvA (DUF1232 family)